MKIFEKIATKTIFACHISTLTGKRVFSNKKIIEYLIEKRVFNLITKNQQL